MGQITSLDIFRYVDSASGSLFLFAAFTAEGFWGWDLNEYIYIYIYKSTL